VNLDSVFAALPSLADILGQDKDKNKAASKQVTTIQGRKKVLWVPTLAHQKQSHVVKYLYCRVKETSQFYNVLKHNAFKADPLGIIQQHLRNSLQVAAEEEKEKERKREKLAATLKSAAEPPSVRQSVKEPKSTSASSKKEVPLKSSPSGKHQKPQQKQKPQPKQHQTSKTKSSGKVFKAKQRKWII
jgi:hypothetical protein